MAAVEISQAEVDAALLQVQAAANAEPTAEDRQKVLDELIDQALLAQAAAQKGFILEEAQLPLSLEPVDPNTIIAASLEQLRPMFQVHEIRVEADFQENLATLYVDWVVTQRVNE